MERFKNLMKEILSLIASSTLVLLKLNQVWRRSILKSNSSEYGGWPIALKPLLRFDLSIFSMEAQSSKVLTLIKKSFLPLFPIAKSPKPNF